MTKKQQYKEKENKLTLTKLFEVEHLKWHKGASLVVHIINKNTPQIIKVEGVFPSLVYIEAIERVIRRKIAKYELEPNKIYKVEVTNTSGSPQTALSSFKLQSFEKVSSSNLEVKL